MIANSVKNQLAKNLPSTNWEFVTGNVINNSIVPDFLSSAQSLIPIAGIRIKKSHGCHTKKEFKSEMMTTRAELRNVKFQLRSDVDNLKTKIMFINIGLIPILIAGLALIIAIRRPNPKKIIH